MKKHWTDERLESFAAQTDRRFDAVDQRFDAVDQRFDAVDQRFDRVERDLRGMRLEMNTRLDRLESRFDGLQRTMTQSSAVMMAGLLGIIATLIATQL